MDPLGSHLPAVLRAFLQHGSLLQTVVARRTPETRLCLPATRALTHLSFACCSHSQSLAAAPVCGDSSEDFKFGFFLFLSSAQLIPSKL